MCNYIYVKIIVFCKVCNEKKDTLICVIERGPNKSEFGHIRFTSTSVQCCNKKTFISVKGDGVIFDLSKSFNFVKHCILKIDVICSNLCAQFRSCRIMLFYSLGQKLPSC